MLDEDSSRKLNKAIFCIGIPILVIMLVVIFLLLLGTIKFNKTNNANVITVTELNETYTGDLIITATDIKVIANPYKEDSNNIVVGVRFEITNNSDINYSSIRDITTYVDDVKVSERYDSLFNGYNEDLYHAGVVPGKKVMGYVTATATRDSQKVEILFEEPSYYTNAKIISFIFDIPTVED